MEDGALVLEKLENAIFDDDDRGEMPFPSIVVITLAKVLVVGASCLVLLASS